MLCVKRLLILNVFFFYSVFASEISKDRLDELAGWFAAGMHEYEKSQPKPSEQEVKAPDFLTQSEVHMQFIAQSKDVQLLPSYTPPPKVTTLQDLRKNEMQLIEWMLKITQWPGYFGSLNRFAPVIKKIIEQEQKFSSDYVFYHAYKEELGLVFDLYREIDNFLLYAATIFSSEKITQPYQETVSIRDIKYLQQALPYKNINDFIEYWENFFLQSPSAFNDWDDHLEQLRLSLLSVNIALFGQTKNGFKESSLYFFITSQSAYQGDFLSDIFKKWNFNEKYKDQLEKLYSNFMYGETGHLLQIFIPADKVNSYVYISQTYGTPSRFKITDTFKEKFVEKEGKKVNMSRHMDIKSILDAFRVRPEFIKSPTYQGYMGINYHYDADDLQARIVLSPSFFDPNNDIKILRYTTAGLEKEFGADYKKGLRTIVGKMMISHILQHKKEIENGSDSVMKNTLQAILQWGQKSSSKKQM